MAQMVTVVLLVLVYAAAVWIVSWMVPRSLRRSRRDDPWPSGTDIPSTVPQEWVDELRDG